MDIVERSFIPLEKFIGGKIYIRVGDIAYFSEHTSVVDPTLTQIHLTSGDIFVVNIPPEDLLKTLVSMYRAALFPPKPKEEKK